MSEITTSVTSLKDVFDEIEKDPYNCINHENTLVRASKHGGVQDKMYLVWCDIDSELSHVFESQQKSRVVDAQKELKLAELLFVKCNYIHSLEYFDNCVNCDNCVKKNKKLAMKIINAQYHFADTYEGVMYNDIISYRGMFNMTFYPYFDSGLQKDKELIKLMIDRQKASKFNPRDDCLDMDLYPQLRYVLSDRESCKYVMSICPPMFHRFMCDTLKEFPCMDKYTSEMALVAVTGYYPAWSFIDEKHKNDKKFIIATVKQNPQVLSRVLSEHRRYDENFILQLLGMALKSVHSDECYGCLNIIRIPNLDGFKLGMFAMSVCPANYMWLSSELRKNKKIINMFYNFELKNPSFRSTVKKRWNMDDCRFPESYHGIDNSKHKKKQNKK